MPPCLEILLITEHKENISYIKDIIEESKFKINLTSIADEEEIKKYTSGEKMFYKSPKPDVILFDDISQKNGRKIFNILKSDKKLEHIPVIFLMNSNTDEKLFVDNRIEGNFYIKKPLKLEQFIKILRKIDNLWFTINLALIDENKEFSEKIRTLLYNYKYLLFDIKCFDNINEYKDKIEEDTDIVLISIKHSENFSENLYDITSKFPVIILSEMEDDEVLKYIKEGVQDSLSKSDISVNLLIKSIKHAIERHKIRSQLTEAMHNLHTMEEFLPICANCKKIRDDHGYWHQIEKYISARIDVKFSHGICPKCSEELYGEYLI